MRFLIVGPIHHHAELNAARRARPDDPPLFPPTQAQYFWVKALRELGHEVSAFYTTTLLGGWRKLIPSWGIANAIALKLEALAGRFPRLNPGALALNRHLIRKVEKFRPDVVMVVGGTNIILPETLNRIRERYNCKLIFLSGTSPVVFFTPNEKAALPIYDLVLTNDAYHAIQCLELNAPRAEALPISACDPDFHRRYELSDDERKRYRCDLAFVGTLTPDHLYSKRVRALEGLRDFDLGIWSVHPVPESLKPFYRGPALGEEMLRIMCAAKIVVNPHGNFMLYGGNMRLFEAAGCGVFQIADDLPGVRKWFKIGQEIVTYRDPAHLRELVGYYLEHDNEREEIASAAQARAYAEHTYRHRMKHMIEMLEPQR